MFTSSQWHSDGPNGANGDMAGASSTPVTPARHGRARHARTNASLTSSSGSTSIDAPISTYRIQRRVSVPNEASRIFQTTGFDPFGTEPDTLFRSLTVKEVEAYERAVRNTALGKQEELRGLVGERYEDLLSTANTIIDMAGSSSQLSQRLHELSAGVTSAALEGEGESSKKAARRKSFLPTQHIPAVPDGDGSTFHQEAIYVLGASLRLIMDAPEYVWKSIEKGKTLQASWAFMLARATWWDLIDTAPLSDTQSSLSGEGEEGISSASEAVSLLKVNVRKAFPFIEKQWQSMLPMRKQIVHRAVALLSDHNIESMAVADQLAALVLIDGTKLDQAVHLLLSQRLTAMRRIIHRGKTNSSSHHRGGRHQTATGRVGEAANGPAHEGAEDRAAQLSQTIVQLVTLFARTLQHAVQIFMLPSKSETTSSSRPLLPELLTTIADSTNFYPGATAATSPPSERTLPLPQHTSISDAQTARQSAAALRALRRRSSYGLPTVDTMGEVASEAAPDCSQQDQARPLRVSTIGVIQALPSARVLLRLLPPSLWSFAPYLDLESLEARVPSQVFAEISSWSTKARETIVGGSGSTSPDTLRSLLSQLSDVSQLAHVRRSLRIALHRARRIASRKLTGLDGSTDERRQEAITKVQSEVQQLEEAIDSVLQERLLHLMEQKLQIAVQEFLNSTEQIMSSVQPVPSSQVAAPLDALFSPIRVDSASATGQERPSADESASPTKSSHIFAAALQDHVCGRSQQVDRLASLYEKPLANLSDELQLYQLELEADERFAGASESIRAKFESILASSRAEVETGLAHLLDKAQSSEAAGDSVGDQTGVSVLTCLVMRLTAVLNSTSEAGSKPLLRQTVKAALERIWKPQLERRISDMLKAGTATLAASDMSKPSVSASVLSVLSTLSESIVQLGPALAGPELAEQVRNILEGVAASDRVSASDAGTLQALLACDAASLSKHIATDDSLHRIRLALSPLVLALATTAAGPSGPSDRLTTEMVLSRAEPASTPGQVKPILAVSRKKVERLSSLPVR